MSCEHTQDKLIQYISENILVDPVSILVRKQNRKALKPRVKHAITFTIPFMGNIPSVLKYKSLDYFARVSKSFDRMLKIIIFEFFFE